MLIAIAVVSIEAAVLWVLGIWSTLALIEGDSSSLASSIFLSGMIFAAALWGTNIVFGLLRFRRWSHTAAMVLQLIAAAIATATLSGEFAQPQIGWPLLIAAATAFIALFNGKLRLAFFEATEK